MSAADLSLCSAGAFFVVGLAAGVWKYAAIATSPAARAPAYVDITHRAALLYAFACALLGQLCRRNAWPDPINRIAVAVLVVFFATAVLGYVVHGLLRDTDNQFKRPHSLGRRFIPAGAMLAFMILLSLGEVGGFLVVFAGFLRAL